MNVPEPVFNAPWEAQAFAMVVALHEAGHFTWPEWSEVLARHVDAEPANTPYYESWLRALETVMSRQFGVNAGMVAERDREWRRAEAATPHGQPIVLGNFSEG